jgi:double-stranded uracil-DNA glycosylase
MIDYHYENSRLLFVGINPHEGSFSRGVPFSNNKMFWYLLSRAGLINEKIEDLRNDKILREIYDKKFNPVYQLGLANIVDRPSRDVSLLKKGEEAPGVVRLESIIRQHKPPVVCFVGKVTYQKFTGLKNVEFGWQPDLYNSKMYVMHFPLRGEASVRIDELREIASYAFSPGERLKSM